jgi:hypothetical protein
MDMNVEFKVEMQVDDDRLIELIASIPSITASIDQIREWLSKPTLDKTAFKAWLERKAQERYGSIMGIKANLDVLEQMFQAGV